MTYHSKAGNLSSADIDLLWEKVSEKQKKKLMGEHEKIRNDYVQEFENFVRVNSSTLIINYLYVIQFFEIRIWEKMNLKLFTWS